MVAGIFLSFVFKTTSYYSGLFFLKIPALIGCALQAASIAVFIYVICRTYFSSEKQKFEIYEGFLLSSYLWFIIQAIAFVALYFHFNVVGNTDIPDVFKNPIRHIQIVGFACMVIIGIFTKTLPIFLGIQEPNQKISGYVLYILNISIALRTISEFYKEYTSNLHGFFAAVFCIAGVLETFGVFLFIYNLNLFNRRKTVKNPVNLPTGFRKYIRAALVWLFVSEGALLTFTVYETLSGERVSHALFGAYRHAIFCRIYQHDDPGMRLQDDSLEQRGKIVQSETTQRNFRVYKYWMCIQGSCPADCHSSLSATLSCYGNEWLS